MIVITHPIFFILLLTVITQNAIAANTLDAFSPEKQERIACSILAAKKYKIPAHILLAIAEKEGGKPGQWVSNSNGTYDVGPMQFNTAYINDLKKHGITANHVAASGCYPYTLAAWRIRKHLKLDNGDIWKKAANYHSRTPKYNSIYRKDLKHKGLKWKNWLERQNMKDLVRLSRLLTKGDLT